jgi:hypothetical protein
MLKTLKTATLPHNRRDFLGLAFRAQQLRRQLPRRACRPARKDRSKYVPSSKVGKLLKACGRNHAVRETKRTMRRPGRQVATSETERRPMLISQPPPWQTGVYRWFHQHTNSITSDEHVAAIHSEDLTRDPARARARRGEGDVP